MSARHLAHDGTRPQQMVSYTHCKSLTCKPTGEGITDTASASTGRRWTVRTHEKNNTAGEPERNCGLDVATSYHGNAQEAQALFNKG